MAITFVGSSKVTTSGSAGSLSLTLPSGIQTGDLILVLAYNWSNCTWATPSGYTLHGDFSGGGDSAAFYKIAGSSDSGASVSIDPNTSTSAFCAVAVVLRGVDGTTPFDVTSGQQTTATDNQVDVDQITTVTNGAWHVLAVGQTNTSLDSTFTTPSGYISREHAFATASSSAVPWEVYTKEYATAGTTTPTAVDSNRTVNGLGWSIAVRPATSVHVDIVAAGPGHATAQAFIDIVRAGPGHSEQPAATPGIWAVAAGSDFVKARLRVWIP